MSFRNYRLRDYDFKLIILVLALSLCGVYAIGSAEPSLQNKQLIGMISGFVILLIVSLIDYHFVLKFYWIIYGFNIVLLLLVLLVGESSHNAQRWLKIGGIQFQPSELAKILLILFFAQFIMKMRERLNTIPVLAACVALLLVPFALIHEQPDLSTSLIVVLIFCIIMYAGGLSYKIIIGILAVAIPGIAIIVSLALKPDSDVLIDYQKNRILAFVYPEQYATEEAYQQLNSVTAIASGMLDGKGYKNNEITSLKNGNFLSEDQTDFIFAVIGEEFGFKGSVVIIVLEFLIALECISVARRASDTAGAIIGAAMGALIGFQGFFNIGVATFLLPNTGLPLPFVSYGLTSLWSCFGGIGFVMNVRLQAKRGNLTSIEEIL
ncbi:MAG: rod shape-determining protein RodA [Lachnospiraceae bacterium]|nr:rod shape-determining protein RodA [Lachnospiraceae bacterium]